MGPIRQLEQSPVIGKAPGERLLQAPGGELWRRGAYSQLKQILLAVELGLGVDMHVELSAL